MTVHLGDCGSPYMCAALDGKGDRAVSKVRWSADGNKLAVGTSEGVLYAFDGMAWP